MEIRSALFREIHKNTWLKRLTADGKKVTIGSKKSEKCWVVFCIHDDTEALLEGYIEPRVAQNHNPDWIISLQTTQHISHALVPNDQEFEFVITLTDEVIRFHAFSWDIMQEWVEVLRSKLREMRILSPKENVYTKLPEIRTPLLPTRDPTSPLPATPPVLADIPGVECLVPTINQQQINIESTLTENSETNSESIITQGEQHFFERLPTSNTIGGPVMSNTLPQNLLNMICDHISNYNVKVAESIEPNISNTNSIEEKPSTSYDKYYDNSQEKIKDSNDSKCAENALFVFKFPQVPDSDSSQAANTISLSTIPTDNCCIRVGIQYQEIEGNENTSKTPPPLNLKDAPFSPKCILQKQQASYQNAELIEPEASSKDYGYKDLAETLSNITIIQVSDSETNSKRDIFKYPSFEKLTREEDFKSNVQIIPSSPSPSKDLRTDGSVHTPPHSKKETNEFIDNISVTNVTVKNNNELELCSSMSSSDDGNSIKKIILSTNTSGITNISVGDEAVKVTSHYDSVFLRSINTTTPTNSQQQVGNPIKSLSPIILLNSSTNQSANDITHSISSKTSTQNKNSNNNKENATPSTSSKTLLEHMKPTIMPRKKIENNSMGTENIPPPLAKRSLTRGLTEAVILVRPSRIDSVKGGNNNSCSLIKRKQDNTRSESLEDRRRSSSFSNSPNHRNRTTSDSRSCNQKSNQVFRSENSQRQISTRLTLREQQVLQLRREIMHPGGVRLQLRRKDCIGSVAWVDAFGGVWVAGWKQKEHPMLYNALHIGDQLMSIAGITISSASEANKVIRNTNTLFLEVLIRRVPFGRVYAIRRELEGQCLGLIRDGNTATIVDVVPNSLAARHGLPPKAQSCDGLSLTFWVLTEINGRPLNLFYKEFEVRDRLNSVGRDISILVQPLDLVFKLKKQLRSLRSYKDYIVQ